MRIEAVDLFCGVGGLTAGLIKSGITVKAGYDIEAACRFAYEYNNKAVFVHKDVAEVTGDELNKWYSPNTIKLLAGCAPCQPFSSYNQGKDTSTDKKWPLLYHFARLIKEVQPDLVTMENVPDVIKHKVYHDFINDLSKLGYQIVAKEIACVDYGVPQTRKRHVVLASKIGKVNFIPPTHEKYITVAEVIKDLEPLEAGGKSNKDSLHVASNLTEINLKRIRASIPGGTWRDWPIDLRAECHKKASGRSYPAVYGRMEWDKPAPTMTTLCYGYGNGRFGHPEQDRAISLREAALFQTFPKDYQFIPPTQYVNIKSVGRMIGNAVPVRLGEIIGLSFQRL
ncbi:TPA: DNA cytosine methyltransferase [Acinetobacter baumannii]|uniref:DNA cytosine methyltransferase n=1 Tax=Acinetobacter baumannii TaxID=470 RepID=UPI00027894E2|nr:DNA cytosine methyltransferase [Acinetobacter baumannii]EJP42300.1 DNA (cytosine-5-)-methyltransferase [Acinetobacter baumannii OIFC032]EKU9601989.1 DNA cytosine methyltransferase [Acinetobacter baumannii]EXE02308.1 DNA (cytosine-5-)-methyltransferase family protein [Acinetobacter baumannii 1096934]EXR81881.1 DNA (cytosine-5-)-methyltransferase family protein [Acinetobacter baumannii 541915]MBP4302226.1 DNA cytosine methyltransferase [Acinetobacter baumannii]